MVVIVWQLDLQLPVQSVIFTTHVEFKTRSWRGILDTTLCDKVGSDLRQVGGFLPVLGFLQQEKTDRYDIAELLVNVAPNTIV